MGVNQNEPTNTLPVASGLQSWHTGLDEHMPPEALETAWLDIRREWRVLLLSADWPRQSAQLRWVSNRMGLIYALREYQAAQAALQVARKGTPWLFDRCGEHDPFAEDGLPGRRITETPFQDNLERDQSAYKVKEEERRE
jgi:hypothetical protein